MKQTYVTPEMKVETIDMDPIMALATSTGTEANQEWKQEANERDDYEDGAAWTDGLW
ncbi:MAG: hypothetical protein J1F25_08185 [Prevotellaceae bacterium]|nr:hypothetical protein [Prevotellaceae bacterium]